MGGRIVITGGSGFLGVSLGHHLAAAGYEVVLVSRSPPPVPGPWRHASWDGRGPGAWHADVDGAAGVVNLAGRTVDCIKTPATRDEILRSRVESTRALGAAVRAAATPPPVWVQMSTAHLYGDPPRAVCVESSPPGLGLAPEVATRWEAAFADSLLPAQRGVVLRTSFVVGRDRGAGGGAISRLRLLVRLGLGGRVASGTQGMSWIHEHDLDRLVERALTDDAMTGAYIASVPDPPSQVEFMRELRGAMRMPVGLPATAWMVRIGAPLLLRTDPDLALYGRYVRSERLPELGFTFERGELRAALEDVVR